MSHVEEVKGDFIDFSILESTFLSLSHPLHGKIIRKNKKTYNWFKRHVGDYPLPEGIKKEDLGKCDYCYGFENDSLYEIGIVEKEGKYVPLYDFWSFDNNPNTEGGPLLEVLGNGGNKFLQAYNTNVVKAACQEEGYTLISESLDAEGNIVLEVEV